MTQPPLEFITDGKEFFVAFSTPLVRGYMPVPIPKGDPILHWNGPKIDLVKSWYPALKFMADHVDHEVILRFFMTRDKSEILVFPLTQIYGTGMTVSEEITKEEREWWASEGLIEAGTMHSHCNGHAFASGTDEKDEKARDGLHITIGKLKGDQFDIHARMTWTIPGEERDGKLVRANMVTVQKPNLYDWFIFPHHVEIFIAAEPELEEGIIKYMLTKPPGKEVQYPDAWNAKLVRKPIMITTPVQGNIADWRGLDSKHYHPGLSSSEDLPEHIKKKETRQRQTREEDLKELDFQKQAHLWDTWSEALTVIADCPELRQAQIGVSEFAPATRGALFSQHQAAIAVWEQISRMLAANHIKEDEFFENWNDTLWSS